MLFPYRTVEEIILVALTLAIAFSVHEFAHAFVAWKFGDNTAKNQGRLTLNPIRHIDPIGAILFFVVGFGWARPVPVNRFFFKNPRLAGILVSAAGPFSNLLLGTLGLLAYLFIMKYTVGGVFAETLISFLWLFFGVNLLLFLFNLLPFPPLDGYRILEDFAPNGLRAKMTQYEQYGALIFLILVLTPLGDYTISPLFGSVLPALQEVLFEFFVQFFR
ncbi:zinc metalloprotease [Bacillus sp. FJAT-18017]|uniref:site-2 protease family protein n=1 Tax=Bacillus sp. FJAT-18017 TaxID=1705566 RepID=UPI0006AFE180|nr:site-2 protease family protein [Bacillus sp. FJAT-18017]ALC88663.1 zinc metalloprotease [Bacillus sp. FJAT-18017]